MYKDIIQYELADNITKNALIAIAKRVHNDWMKNQPGFLKWEIHTDKEGNMVDIVFWESKEAAQAAEMEMVNIPNAGEWFACYKEGTIVAKNVTLIAAF